MSAYTIYRELSKVGHWAQLTRKVRWLAARYYAGVETYDELVSHAHAQAFDNRFLPPLLSGSEVRMIIDLR